MYLQAIQFHLVSFEGYINGVMVYLAYEWLYLLHVIHLRLSHTEM